MTTTLTWKRAGADWVLFNGRRRVGRVVPDPKWPGMWRSVMFDGGLSDMANLAWSKNAVLLSAEREIEYAARSANRPSNPQQNEGVFEPSALPVAETTREVARAPPSAFSAPSTTRTSSARSSVTPPRGPHGGPSWPRCSACR